jgi:predicted TIM-barrel fold metal-dependent hydrolase
VSDPRPIFDAHLHIIDPAFELIANQGFRPAPFRIDDYRAAVSGLGVVGGAVVSGSFQGFDQLYLLDALEKLGPEWVGVTQLPATVSDEELSRLDAAGVRAVRFNLFRGGSEAIDALEQMAHRVFDRFGWHVELYVDGRELGELETVLADLPRISIDHLGLVRDGLPTLQRLIERGHYVKATGFGRLDFNPADAIRAIVEVDPKRLMFGTDLPSTRAARPFTVEDLRLVERMLEPPTARLVLHDNARDLYRPRGARSDEAEGARDA